MKNTSEQLRQIIRETVQEARRQNTSKHPFNQIEACVNRLETLSKWDRDIIDDHAKAEVWAISRELLDALDTLEQIRNDEAMA